MHGRAVLIFTVLATFAACGGPEPIDDLLFLQTPAGVTVVRADATAPTFRATSAVPSRDWSTVVKTRLDMGVTYVTASLPASGTELWAGETPGRWNAKVVSEDGQMAALGPTGERPYNWGRRHTQLTVVDRDDRERKFGLKGNFEPEAFSTDKSDLFVLQYRPARAPTSYQVRRLNLRTGKLWDIYTPDKHLQEAMRGDARVQAVSPDGRRLYTLYSLRTAHGTHSFVHVLDLDEKWAHCIDLPQNFGIGASSTALSVSEDGERLFVANGAAHAVAEVDTQLLRVARWEAVDFGEPKRAVAAQTDNTLYVGVGSSMTAIDTETLTPQESWTMKERIRGIQIEHDPDYLYVGLRDVVLVIDPVSGKRLKSVDPAGVGRIGLLGRATRTINEVPEHLTCAC
jgi:hypothetical protein